MKEWMKQFESVDYILFFAPSVIFIISSLLEALLA